MHRSVINRIKRILINLLLNNKEQEQLKIVNSDFPGKVHYWTYDRFWLKRLIQQAGSKKISIKNPNESDIPDWNAYELDVKGGCVIDPTSIFMEATK